MSHEAIQRTLRNSAETPCNTQQINFTAEAKMRCTRHTANNKQLSAISNVRIFIYAPESIWRFHARPGKCFG